jgi:hypothetical protein
VDAAVLLATPVSAHYGRRLSTMQQHNGTQWSGARTRGARPADGVKGQVVSLSGSRTYFRCSIRVEQVDQVPQSR